MSGKNGDISTGYLHVHEVVSDSLKSDVKLATCRRILRDLAPTRCNPAFLKISIEKTAAVFDAHPPNFSSASSSSLRFRASRTRTRYLHRSYHQVIQKDPFFLCETRIFHKFHCFDVFSDEYINIKKYINIQHVKV